KDNRQAFYRMLGDFFYPGDSSYRAEEIPSDKEVKKAEELAVEMPEANADFNVLARRLAKDLPRLPPMPADKAAAEKWGQEQRARLLQVVHAKDLEVKAERTGTSEKDGLRAVYWKLRLGGAWSVPVVELTRGTPRRTAILVNDAGRKADPVNAGRLLEEG